MTPDTARAGTGVSSANDDSSKADTVVFTISGFQTSPAGKAGVLSPSSAVRLELSPGLGLESAGMLSAMARNLVAVPAGPNRGLRTPRAASRSAPQVI